MIQDLHANTLFPTHIVSRQGTRDNPNSVNRPQTQSSGPPYGMAPACLLTAYPAHRRAAPGCEADGYYDIIATNRV